MPPSSRVALLPLMRVGAGWSRPSCDSQRCRPAARTPREQPCRAARSGGRRSLRVSSSRSMSGSWIDQIRCLQLLDRSKDGRSVTAITERVKCSLPGGGHNFITTCTVASAHAVGRQPLLHDLVTCLAAPCIVLSDRDGQIRPDGAQGAFVADVRVLSRGGRRSTVPTADPISHPLVGPDGAEFVAVVRGLGDPSPDPTVWLRRRRMADGRWRRRRSLTVVNRSGREVSTTLDLRLAADLARDRAGEGGSAERRRSRPDRRRTGCVTERIRVTVDVVLPGARVCTWTMPGRWRSGTSCSARGRR